MALVDFTLSKARQFYSSMGSPSALKGLIMKLNYSRTSIIRISRLSWLFLWSRFVHEYLLVMIKIRSHILFETTALKGAVKCKGFLLSKSKSSTRVCRNEWRTFKWFLIGSELCCCWVKFHTLFSFHKR